MILRFTVPGEPVPKGRPRFATVAGHARAYTPAATRSHEVWVRLHAIEAMAGLAGFPLDGPLRVRLDFYLRRPPSRRKRDTLPDRKPDLDNLVKSTLDGLSLAMVFVGDSRIVELHARKLYGPPRTEILVDQIGLDT